VIWSREDDTKHGFLSAGDVHHLAAGLDAQNKRSRGSINSSPHQSSFKFGPLQNGIDATLIDGAADMPYAVPNVFVNRSPPSCRRFRLGSGGRWALRKNAFVVECFMDEVAAAAGRDPYELRRELLHGEAASSWHPRARRHEGGLGAPLPSGHGRGIAIAEWEPTVCAEVAEVSVAPDGTVRVHRVVCAVDCGPVVNPDTLEAQDAGWRRIRAMAALFGEITIESGRVNRELQRLSGAAYAGDAARRGATRGQHGRVGRYRRAIGPADGTSGV